MYGVLKIKEPSGPASDPRESPSATIMVCTVDNRLSLIQFPPTTRPGAALLIYVIGTTLANPAGGQRRLDAWVWLLHIAKLLDIDGRRSVDEDLGRGM